MDFVYLNTRHEYTNGVNISIISTTFLFEVVSDITLNNSMVLDCFECGQKNYNLPRI